MMTFSRASLFVVVGMVMGVGLPACGGLRLNVKAWYLDKDQGGLIRKHTNAPTEVMPFEIAKGYRCVNANDFDMLIALAKQAGIRGIH